jgi:hypothetical protein
LVDALMPVPQLRLSCRFGFVRGSRRWRYVFWCGSSDDGEVSQLLLALLQCPGVGFGQASVMPGDGLLDVSGEVVPEMPSVGACIACGAAAVAASA